MKNSEHPLCYIYVTLVAKALKKRPDEEDFYQMKTSKNGVQLISCTPCRHYSIYGRRMKNSQYVGRIVEAFKKVMLKISLM